MKEKEIKDIVDKYTKFIGVDQFVYKSALEHFINWLLGDYQIVPNRVPIIMYKYYKQALNHSESSEEYKNKIKAILSTFENIFGTDFFNENIKYYE